MQNSIYLQTFIKMAPICQLPWTYSKHLVPFSPLRVAYRAGQIVRPRNENKMDISLEQEGGCKLELLKLRNSIEGWYDICLYAVLWICMTIPASWILQRYVLYVKSRQSSFVTDGKSGLSFYLLWLGSISQMKKR